MVGAHIKNSEREMSLCCLEMESFKAEGDEKLGEWQKQIGQKWVKPGKS